MQQIVSRLRPGQRLALLVAVAVIGVYWVVLVGVGGPPPHVTSRKQSEDAGEGKLPEPVVSEKAVLVNDKPKVEMIIMLDGAKQKVIIEIDRHGAPITAANFIALVRKNFYDGCVFYRAEPGFVLQGGARDAHGKSKKPPFSPIPLEAKLPNNRGTISMARTNDPNSASTEFFINLRDNGGLDAKPGLRPNGYAAFGTVLEGMSVLERAVAKPTTPGGGIHYLADPIEIVRAVVLRE